MSNPSVVIYASPTGGSSAPGTFEAPASLTRALTLARSHLPAAADSVWIVMRDGIYAQASTLAFTQADNGLSLVAYPNENPTISGGVNVGTLVDDGSSQGVGKATLSTITLDVWANGKRATRARSAQVTGWGTVTSSSTGFVASSADATTISGFARKADLVVMWGASWRWGYQSISSVSGTALTARTNGWTLALSQKPILPQPLWYENARELMGLGTTTAGYWYWNAATSLLFYQPRSGETIGTVSVIAGQLSQVVTLTGTNTTPCTVILRGITISHSSYTATQTSLDYAGIQQGVGGNNGNTSGTGGPTDPNWLPVELPAAVTTQYYSGTISGCTISHHGTHGLWLSKGTQGATISGNTITDVGVNGIVIGGALIADETAVAADQVKGNFIRDNTITSFGQNFRDGVGICGLYTSSNIVEHNEIAFGFMCSMTLGWGWGLRTLSPTTLLGNCIVRSNYCHDDTQAVVGSFFMAGLGSLYFNNLDNQAGMQTVVSGNYSNTGGVQNGCYYCDNGSGGAADTVAHVLLTGNVGVGAQLFEFNNVNSPPARNCYGVNSFWSTNAEHNAGADPSCVFSGNVNSVTGATALAIIADAGTR